MFDEVASSRSQLQSCLSLALCFSVGIRVVCSLSWRNWGNQRGWWNEVTHSCDFSFGFQLCAIYCLTYTMVEQLFVMKRSLVHKGMVDRLRHTSDNWKFHLLPQVQHLVWGLLWPQMTKQLGHREKRIGKRCWLTPVTPHYAIMNFMVAKLMVRRAVLHTNKKKKE